ncbi:hypothetical protein DFJ74DRAFT_672775 [Hyaloraphidium curvatum]|nr:hypothetical protein DFJ74DRAFT_672775 [Hyaloraphidium curvatum]
MPTSAIAASSPPTTHPMISPRLGGAAAGAAGGAVADPPADQEVAPSASHCPTYRSCRRQLPPSGDETADWRCERPPLPGIERRDQKAGRMPCRRMRLTGAAAFSAGRTKDMLKRAARRARSDRRRCGTRKSPVWQSASSKVPRFARHADELPGRTSLYSEQLGAPWQSTIQSEPLVSGSRKHNPESALHCTPQVLRHGARGDSLSVKTFRKLPLPAKSTMGVPVGPGRREPELVLVVVSE